MRDPKDARVARAALAAFASLMACCGPTEPDSARITEVSMRLDIGNGFGYALTVGTDGSARDVRSVDLAPDAACAGRVSVADFDRVAAVFDAEDFFALEAQYGFFADHSPEYSTAAVRDGARKTVRNYRGMAPPPLARVQEALRQLRRGTVWTAESGQPRDQQLCSLPFLYND